MTVDARQVGVVAQGGSGTSATTSSGTSNATGSTFLVAFTRANGPTVQSVTDSKSNSYSKLGSTRTFPLTEWWICEDGVGGSGHTATVTFDTTGIHGTFHLIEVTESGGIDLQSGQDYAAFPASRATGTMAETGELVLALCGAEMQESEDVTSSNMDIFSRSAEAPGTFAYMSVVAKAVAPGTTFTANFNGTEGGTILLATFKQGETEEPPETADIDARLVSKVTGADSSLQTASGQTTQTGSTFVVGISCDNPTIASVTDTFGNTYTLAPSINQGGAWDSAFYVCENGTGGDDHQVTVTWTGLNGAGTVHLIEITGAAEESLDVEPSPAHDESSPFTLASGTLSTPNQLLLSLCASDGDGGGGYGISGWEILSNGDDPGVWTSAVAKRIVSSTDSVTASWTDSEATAAHVHVLSFKAAATTPAAKKHGMLLGIG